MANQHIKGQSIRNPRINEEFLPESGVRLRHLFLEPILTLTKGLGHTLIDL